MGSCGGRSGPPGEWVRHFARLSAATGIDPLRLVEIDEADGSMLRALEEAHRERRTPEMELLRLILKRVDLLWRQTVVFNGGQEPDPIEVLLPGEKAKKKSLRGVAAKAMANLRG